MNQTKQTNDNMKKVIAIVCGGDSSEHGVSMRSADAIYSFLDKERYDCYIVELCARKWEVILSGGERLPIDRNDFSFIVPCSENPDKVQKIIPDFAYITIHGTPGENGILQGYFELLRIPYSTSGVLVEALTFHKFVLNNYLRSYGITVAESLLVRKGQENALSEEEIIGKVGLPCFVKPADDGSSFGVTKVKTIEELRPALEVAFAEDSDVMIEAYLDGTEITCGCYKTNGEVHVLPITEVVTEQEFFDYDAKYNGKVDEITPARIDEKTAERVSKLTAAIYEILGCRGIIRIDYILTGTKGKETINMLEVNTTPGMTATSFIPQQIRAAGLEPRDVLTDIIEHS